MTTEKEKISEAKSLVAAGKPVEGFKRFLDLSSAGGILLIVAAVLALLIANSPLATYYYDLIGLPASVRIGPLQLEKPLLLWINDGLMAIFFLFVGLEVKREFKNGHLSEASKVALPAIAAVGGIALPALTYFLINRGDSAALNGWAIPAATDIAFALGVLYLLGDRVRAPLKVFLLTVAIFDDLAAIFIIGVFYTSDLSLSSLALAAIALVALFLINRRGVENIPVYIVIGIALWIFVLRSGVHATLAGVALAFAIPMKNQRDETNDSPLHQMMDALQPWVAYLILPIFAFANAGVSLAGLSPETIVDTVTLGIIVGLFVGKQVGVFSLSVIGIKLGVAQLPGRMSWFQLYGVSVLCGIGFTMSLFISSLAFGYGGEYGDPSRLGILLGSVISGALGLGLLHYALPPAEAEEEE